MGGHFCPVEKGPMKLLISAYACAPIVVPKMRVDGTSDLNSRGLAMMSSRCWGVVAIGAEVGKSPVIR